MHGRNLAARNAVFASLGALGLLPVEWEEAHRPHRKGLPPNLEAVRAAMAAAQAVVVLLTAEDEAKLLPGLVSDHDGARADPGGPGAGAASSSPRRALGTAGALLMRIAARGARPPASAPRDP